MDCSFCTNKATNKCLCKNKVTYLCDTHFGQHFKQGNQHNIIPLRRLELLNESNDKISETSSYLIKLTNEKITRIKNLLMLSNYFLSEINNLTSASFNSGILDEDFVNFITSALKVLIDNFEEGCRQELQEKNHENCQYLGEMQDDMKDGIGVFKNNDDIYIGRWRDDEKHGKGIYYHKAGEVYVGEYIRDIYDGRGELRFANGDTYTGEFRQGEISGYGKKRLINGTVFKGQWVKGNLHGDGAITDQNGNVYQGLFRNGNKHGPGVYKTSEGHTFKESYIDGNKMS
ncbi:hypothetical protein SteCoe_18628 [Stentor coeruleus]|uniref:MORN repeat protein n=1 Tax=Stentor coeruleus TaxID=5963 RepID=A0A1R2BW20_9CILI|nr:hypothetical protein SteCoe_18628 [Stentor coeruleus]